MLTTETRPAPLPPRPTAPTAAPAATRRPLPAGAVRWSKPYLDDKGVPHRAEHEVPVDADDKRTPHVRHTCVGDGKRTSHIEVNGVKQPCDQVAWILPGDPVKHCPDHGCQLVPDGAKAGGDPLLPWAAMWQALEPSARAGYLLAAGVAAGVAVEQANVPAWEVLAATPAMAGAAWWGTRRWLTKRALKRDRIEEGQTDGRRVRTINRRARTAGYIATATGSWLTLAATTDPHTWPGRAVWASLPVVWAVAAVPWWRYLAAFRDRPEPEAPTVEAEAAAVTAELDPAAVDAAKTWADEVGIAGTHLDAATWQAITCGWQAVIVATKRGALNPLGGDAMKATVKRVASAFDVPKSAVTWIEEHDDSPNRALLLIQPNNPLKEGQIWAGPDSITITESRIVADVGRFIDSTSMLETLFRFDEGMPGELVLGTTGSGKSERLRLKLLIQRWASFVNAHGQRQGLFLSFLHDPKRLNSYGEFRDVVHGYGITRDDAHIMVDAFLREMVRRYDLLSSIEWVDAKGRKRRGAVKWNPMVHGPLLSAIWDEFHELAGDAAFVAKQEKLARYIRACGMGQTVASHMGTIGDTGSQASRDMVAGGRATLLRTTSGLNAGLATGGQLVGDPRALPKAGGMTLVADGESPTVMGRYAFVPDDRGAALLGERSMYDWLFDDDNNPIGYPAEIPAETAEAFGPEFMQWMAAGRSEQGRMAGVFKSSAPAVSAEDLSSAEALRRILFEGSGPMRRAQIQEHPRWTFGVTSTLTDALRKAQDAAPPWVVKTADGKAYELTAAAREDMAARLAEVGQ